MEKKSFAEKLAEKSFKSAKVQESWKVHTQAFGPILEPAFVNDFKTRIDLIVALNKISSRDIRGGLDKLKKLQPACKCDADHAAWFFCMGLAFEMAGAKDQTIQMYQQAGQYGHRFYLPYLKVAKFAHNDAVFEVAEENYQDAIRCFDGEELTAQSQTILASAYTNYASCLTMMHRYDEAELALSYSAKALPNLPGRAATQAILYAALNDGDKVEQYLQTLQTEAPTMVPTTQKMTDEILKGEHPHFSEIPLTEEQISAFWTWFVANEGGLAEKIQNQAFDQAFVLLQEQLKPLFPYLERDPDCAFEPQDTKICITVADYYMVSLEKSYQQLLSACPDGLKSRWCFEIVH